MKRKLKRKIVKDIILFLFLTAGLLIVVMPMVYMVSTSLKPNGALYEFPPRFFPRLKEVTVENYQYIIGEGKFYINFVNSIVVSITTVAAAALIAAAFGFCIARFNFLGKNLLFVFIMLTMIIPGMTLIVPQYELAVWLKAIGKLTGLIPFYIAWVIPYSTFMIKGFVETVPRELDEAVYIDGGSVFTVFFRIILPLTKPGIASVSIFNFLTAWEEFPWANTVINDNAKRTLPIAIAGFFGQHQFTQWGFVFALSVLSLLPILMVFIFCQKFFVAGLTTGSIKG
ncbi:carbohydrate ABC transporter permease [Anaerocolumna aminovalerica]|uniref:carbohydrate ABC transporter permease n=1 Tax=Anaerocolumna aminovalerica TaxID=1527 RepID=UPI000BE3AB1C|nr:carbohydrate ABC transporter permease [Anaerocolumna aminovalerica]